MKTFKKDPREDVISSDKILTFFENIDVDPLDPVTLAISYHFKAETMSQYTKSEFCNGLAELKFAFYIIRSLIRKILDVKVLLKLRIA